MQAEKKKILDLLYYEPYKVGHWVGFTDLTQLHNKWLRDFLYRDDDQTLLAHRGSFKTTVLSLFLALFIVLFPNKFVIFFRKTDDDTKEVIKQVQKILAAGCMQKIIYTLYGKKLILTKSTDSEIHTNLCTSIKGQSQLIGLGIGTSITGKHADVVVTDDIVNLKDRISAAERKLTRLQYMELQNIKNRDGRFINTGTPWHKEDAISIMPNVTRYDCYSTGLITREKLEAIRNAMTDSLFAANYELKHIADSDALFASPQFTSNVESLYNGVAHIDARYSGQDYTAFTILKQIKDENGIHYIGFGKLFDRHVSDCLNEIEAYLDKYLAGTIFVETNADKGYLKREITERGRPCKSYHESTNKFIKITTYLKDAWSNIKWIEATDPEYINQILDYSETAAHDDAPDSAASLIRQLSSSAKLNRISGGF